MKTLEIVGYKRQELGTSSAKAIREDGNVPCVLYGANMEPVHFYSPYILFRDLIYTSDIYKVKLNIEGDEYEALMQDASFHPVNDMILHVDFMKINEGRAVKAEIPIRLEGLSVGVQKGGKLVSKLRKVKVKSLPSNLPEYVSVDITNLDLGKSIRVNSIPDGDFEILNAATLPVATVEIPRSLRSEQAAKK